MGSELTIIHQELAAAALPQVLPLAIAKAGRKASTRFFEFFTVTIRNPNTRAAYWRAACTFFAWCEVRGLSELTLIEPMHLAAYIEELGHKRSKSTVMTDRLCCAPPL